MIIDMSIKKCKAGGSLPGSRQINKLYLGNFEGTQVHGFRTLFVDMFTTGARNFDSLNNIDQYSPQFLSALVKNLARLKAAAESDLRIERSKKANKSAQDVKEAEEATRFGKCADMYHHRGESDPVVLDP